MGDNKYPQGSCPLPFTSDWRSVGFILIRIIHDATNLEPCRPAQNKRHSKMTPEIKEFKNERTVARKNSTRCKMCSSQWMQDVLQSLTAKENPLLSKKQPWLAVSSIFSCLPFPVMLQLCLPAAPCTDNRPQCSGTMCDILASWLNFADANPFCAHKVSSKTFSSKNGKKKCRQKKAGTIAHKLFCVRIKNGPTKPCAALSNVMQSVSKWKPAWAVFPRILLLSNPRQ